MTYLDNGEVRVGMDLALGGAVTFMSAKDHPGKIINSADLGRQIQMSHYSGPWPCEVGDKKPHAGWAGLGWNPIQTGDCFLNPTYVTCDWHQPWPWTRFTATEGWAALVDDNDWGLGVFKADGL